MVPHFGTICVQGRTDACMGCSDQISERRCYSHLGYWCFYYLYSSAREGVDSSLYGSTSSVALPTLSWNVGRLALQDILYMLQALAVVYRYKIQHWIWKFSVKKKPEYWPDEFRIFGKLPNVCILFFFQMFNFTFLFDPRLLQLWVEIMHHGTLKATQWLMVKYLCLCHSLVSVCALRLQVLALTWTPPLSDCPFLSIL